MKPSLDLFEQLAMALAPREDRGAVRVAFQGARVLRQAAERERLREDRKRSEERAATERAVRAERRAARASSDGYDPKVPPAELWGAVPVTAIPAVVRSSRTLRDGGLTPERNVRYQR